MKLYEVPQRQNVRVRVVEESVKTPPSARTAHTNEVLTFDHVDGMYSFCMRGDGEIVHLAAWTEVEIV